MSRLRHGYGGRAGSGRQISGVRGDESSSSSSSSSNARRNVDVILVHARAAEDKFVSDGFGVNRRDVMYNDFIIMGPEADPASIGGMTDAQAALKKIHDGQHAFVSRGDESGTHKKEKLLWSLSELAPKGAWYLEAGQGMSATLRIADEKNALWTTFQMGWLKH